MNEFLEIIKQTNVPIPTLEILTLLVMLTISLIFKATRIGLLVSYLFVFRWGWLFINETFREQHESFLFSYLAFGALVTLLSVIMMLRPTD
jgi:hypothetical protein